jgi:hypothetical protein
VARLRAEAEAAEGAGGLSETVIALGPKEAIDQRNNLHVMPILSAEEAIFESGTFANILEVAVARANADVVDASKGDVAQEDFRAAVQAFLNFHHIFRGEAQLMAKLISDHAVPVGSGTVARTERIPIEERAEAATIAWMRHQTTGYDTMVIPRVKGRRREVRRMLAQRSVQLLARYRQGQPIEVTTCPLARALAPHRPNPLAPASNAPAQIPLAF